MEKNRLLMLDSMLEDLKEKAHPIWKFVCVRVWERQVCFVYYFSAWVYESEAEVYVCNAYIHKCACGFCVIKSGIFSRILTIPFVYDDFTSLFTIRLLSYGLCWRRYSWKINSKKKRWSLNGATITVEKLPNCAIYSYGSRIRKRGKNIKKSAKDCKREKKKNNYSKKTKPEHDFF